MRPVLMGPVLMRPVVSREVSVHAATGLRRRTEQVVLTLAAVLGVVSVLMVLAAPVLGVRPLIFMSGSMSPTIPAGSLGLSRTVPAAELRVGDVVTVPEGEDTYVTHRIVAVTQHEGTATLELKGDGNKAPDAQLRQVTEAPRLLVSAPWLGTLVAWFSRAPGVYVLAGYVVVALGMLRRRREQLGREDARDT
jgi:signal peptidase I